MFTKTITIVELINSQQQDIKIDLSSTLSRYNIVKWQVWTGGREVANGKAHASETTVKHARLQATKGTDVVVDIPLQAGLSGSDNLPKPINLNRIDVDNFTIKLNTDQDINNKVFEITFYIQE